MYTKDKRLKRTRLQELHEIKESIIDNDSDEEETQTNDIFNQLSDTSGDYKHFDYVSIDINIFYKNIYDYFIEGGISNIILKHLVNICMLIMTNIFSVYILIYIEWGKLITDCKYSSNNCVNLNEYVSYDIPIHPVLTLFNVLSGVYICIYLYKLLFNVGEYCKIKRYYNGVLHIDNNILNVIKWKQILDKLKNSNDSRECTIDKNTSELNKFDIITRINRVDNIIISFVNSDIIFKGTSISHNIIFTKYIKTICRFFIFNQIFDKKYNISPTFRSSESYKWYLAWVIFLNIILLPFILFYVVISNILNNSKNIKNNTQLFNYKWTNYAMWKYREYNELEFEFNDRMFKSYFHMNKYISYFPDKTTNIFIYFVRFILSMFILFLFILSIIDDDALIKLKYHNYNLVWYFAVLTLIMSVLNSILKDKDFEDSIDKVIENLTNYIHVLPPKDIIYNYQMYKSIIKMYQSNIVIILHEIVSVIISPYILYKCFYQNADEIVEFLYKNTTYIENLGIVDKYSNFMLNYNIEDKLKHTIQDIRTNKKEDITNLILYKKREKSFISFIELYPDWKMYSTDLEEYIHKINTYKEEISQDIVGGQSMMFSSEMMFSSIQGGL